MSLVQPGAAPARRLGGCNKAISAETKSERCERMSSLRNNPNPPMSAPETNEGKPANLSQEEARRETPAEKTAKGVFLALREAILHGDRFRVRELAPEVDWSQPIPISDDPLALALSSAGSDAQCLEAIIEQADPNLRRANDKPTLEILFRPTTLMDSLNVEDQAATDRIAREKLRVLAAKMTSTGWADGAPRGGWAVLAARCGWVSCVEWMSQNQLGFDGGSSETIFEIFGSPRAPREKIGALIDQLMPQAKLVGARALLPAIAKKIEEDIKRTPKMGGGYTSGPKCKKRGA